ncbi:MAG TPA: TonB-dependent receptor plug domain-containing protein [Robiginitalea sp.]|nr:TonB-dependent receptor plug domain-containing protein [Robiginitalea sp.]
MKKAMAIGLGCCLLALAGCGGSKSTPAAGAVTAEQIEARNQAVLPLLTRIRRLPGISVQFGVPVFMKGNNSIQDGARSEPLYVVDGIAVGNSFQLIQDIVQPVDVESIRAISGAEASFYGSRGANGVILITTRKGKS